MGRGPASLLAKPALNGSHAVAVSYPAPFPIRPSPPDQAQPSAPSRDSLDAAPAVRLGRSVGRRRVPRRRGLTRPERPRASLGLTEVFEVRKIARRLLNALRFSGFLAKARDCRRSASGAKRASLYIFLPDARPAPHEGHAGPRRLGAPLESAMLTWPRDARPRAVPGLVGAIVVIAPVRGLFREPLRRASGSRPRRVSCPRPGLWRARRRGGPRCGPPQAVRPSPRTLQFCTPSSEPS